MNRHKPLVSRTPLGRGKPLERRKPLTARTPLRVASAPKGRHRTGRTAPRDTGPDPKTRALVLIRDGYACVRCGCPSGPGIGQYSLQHRKARGVGGGNSPQNLILLCGTATSPGGCHLMAESRDREAQAQGYWLESWQDPAFEGVLYASEHGSGITLWLAADGGLLTEPPESAA